MSASRAAHLLAAIVVALAAVLLLAVAFDATTILAALDIVDAALLGLGFAISALAAMVGALVVADVKADLDHARSWQVIRQFEISADRPGIVEPRGPYDPRYVDGPQNEELQRLLLAHRRLAPQAFSTDRLPRVACADPADLDAPRTDEDFRNTGLSTATGTPSDGQCKRGTDAVNRALKLVAGSNGRQHLSGSAIRAHGRRGVVRAAPTPRLVANVGWWSVCAGQAAVASRSEPNVGLAADVIVLADHSGRHLPPPDPGLGADAAAPAQPACRGPPSGEGRHRAVVARTSGHAASDRTRPPRSDASTAHGVPVVVDNLPDHVPVCAAELDAIETYLDDVLREVLGGDGAGRDGTVP